MTNEEQTLTMQALGDVISDAIGLREQLEVIRILNPAANVNSTDTECQIGRQFSFDKIRDLGQCMLVTCQGL